MLRVTATPIVGNSHTDCLAVLDQQVALEVCVLVRIFLAACTVWSLCGVKGRVTSYLLVSQATLGQGGYFGWWLRPLVWRFGYWLHLISEQQIWRSVWTYCRGCLCSRMTDGPSDGSGSACTVESNQVPVTTGRVYVSADSAVLTSFILSGSSIGFGGSGDCCTCFGTRVVSDICGGMSTTAVSWD